MQVSVNFKKEGSIIPCHECGKALGRFDSFWVRNYGYDRFHHEMYSCYVRCCENCFRRNLVGKSRKRFFCQGCFSLKPFDSAVRYGLDGGVVYVCEECNDRAVDEYFTAGSAEPSYNPVRYDCVCSVCGRAFMRSDTNLKHYAWDDPEEPEECVCDVCSGLLQLGEDRFLDFLGVDLDTLEAIQSLYQLREAGRLEGLEA